MAMTEAMRLSILSEFAETMGEEKAAALMESISPVPWQEFATKDDLKALKEWAEAKFEAQSVAMNGQFNYLKGEIAKVEGSLSTQIAGLANQIAEQSNQIAEQSKEIAGQSKEIAGQSKEMARQTRTIVFWLAMFAFAMCAALVVG